MRLLSASDFECIIHAIIVSVSVPVLNVSFSLVRVRLPRQFMSFRMLGPSIGLVGDLILLLMWPCCTGCHSIPK